ncbi:hypothetical protein BJ085DRAFT_34921 [Dimargaris cristalligena]|uniref:Uncharacterized protein n=1 Tax=Dimargaris cristalligena TaxID=215637 RepID=A0A4P9ZMU4_9FUNG|nr:hypothetical protein BJ085DRAFT_34921 [Dimargaris cristalligena]|eukprot:RKP34714.1 hypothetical protein BJ085DRAFT_34921 [Dimargaris cristalligena]
MLSKMTISRWGSPALWLFLSLLSHQSVSGIETSPVEVQQRGGIKLPDVGAKFGRGYQRQFEDVSSYKSQSPLQILQRISDSALDGQRLPDIQLSHYYAAVMRREAHLVHINRLFYQIDLPLVYRTLVAYLRSQNGQTSPTSGGSRPTLPPTDPSTLHLLSEWPQIQKDLVFVDFMAIDSKPAVVEKLLPLVYAALEDNVDLVMRVVWKSDRVQVQRETEPLLAAQAQPVVAKILQNSPSSQSGSASPSPPARVSHLSATLSQITWDLWLPEIIAVLIHREEVAKVNQLLRALSAFLVVDQRIPLLALVLALDRGLDPQTLFSHNQPSFANTDQQAYVRCTTKLGLTTAAARLKKMFPADKAQQLQTLDSYECHQLLYNPNWLYFQSNPSRLAMRTSAEHLKALGIDYSGILLPVQATIPGKMY